MIRSLGIMNLSLWTAVPTQKAQKLSSYVYISPRMTSPRLHDLCLFLWLNIISVTSKSANRRGSLHAQARGIIVHKDIDGRERSLDLLFGILTFINWFAHLPNSLYMLLRPPR